MQIVFQDPFGALSPRMSVAQIVGEGLGVHRIGGSTGERRELVAEALAEVGIDPALRDRYPHEFSGGQRQRIAIARAMILRPRFVVLDEPTSALDVSVQAQILNLLQDLRRELNLTFVLISHNLAVVEHMAERVAVMYLGRVIEAGSTAQIFDDPLHPYTRALLESALTPDTNRGLPNSALGAGFPNPLEPPSGCRFRARCPLAFEQCAEEPPFVGDGNGRAAACWKVGVPVQC